MVSVTVSGVDFHGPHEYLFNSRQAAELFVKNMMHSNNGSKYSYTIEEVQDETLHNPGHTSRPE